MWKHLRETPKPPEHYAIVMCLKLSFLLLDGMSKPSVLSVFLLFFLSGNGSKLSKLKC